MRLHLVNWLTKDTKRFEDILVLDASVYEQFNVYYKKAHRGLSAMQTARSHRVSSLMRWQQRGERSTVSTNVKRRFQSWYVEELLSVLEKLVD